MAVRKRQSKPTVQNSKKRGFLQNALQGGREPEFEPFTKIGQFEPGNEDIRTKNDKTKFGTEKTKTANGKIGNSKINSKEKTSAVQKYSNHIEFVDYLPTHEVITYRHLFAYGFYIV